MTSSSNDSLKTSIAKLIGKKPADLKPESGPNVVRSWENYLAGEGYTVTRYLHPAKVDGRHVVLYGAPDGSVQATLSDSDEAASVTPIARLTVTKTAKAGDSGKA